MTRTAKSTVVLFSVAVAMIFETVPLSAQGGYSTEPTSPLVWIALVVIVTLLSGFFLSYLRRRQSDSEEGADPEPAVRTYTVIPPGAVSPPSPHQSVPGPSPLISVAQPPLVKLSKSVFISYRRQDSQHITGRIYDRLATKFGKDSVFKDVDNIPLGFDFREHLQLQVSQCAVLIAVIGKRWNQVTPDSEQRLKSDRDYLRIEIEAALQRRIPVIPVLVDGAEMPAEEELPPSLSRLAYYNGISVRPDPDFHHDADRLVRGVEQLLK